MKLRISAIFPVSALLVVAAMAMPSRAETVINFDDLAPGSAVPLPDGYAGLNWDNVSAGNGCTAAAQSGGAGYCNGVTSPFNIALNGTGNLASFSAPSGTFTLNSLEVTSAFADEQVTFTGYHLGVPIYQVTVDALESGPTLETLNWIDVDSIGFISGTGGQETQAVLDDITINGNVASPVPEPSSLVMTGTGVLGFLSVARRKFIKA